MMRCLLNSALMLVLGTCLLLVSCGKKAKTQDSSRPETIKPPLEIDTFLEKQDVNCETNQACPSYISKIVVIKAGKYEFCTGFLTDDQTIATSSSCLPNLLRLSGQDCSRDVFFFFPKTANRPAERVGCDKVEQVSQIEGQDPILWRDDVAFLKMARPLTNRRQANIVRDGVLNNKQYISWMIDQQGDFSANIKRSVCDSVHQNYVNPLVLNESSPNMIFAGCAVTVGGTGAPVIDSKGRVRAMISKVMDPQLRTYIESTGLLVNGLKDIFHATNFACAPTPYDNNTLDEKECSKDLTYQKIDRLRSEMLSTNILFGDLKKKYEAALEKSNKYFLFGVKLIPKGDVQETELYPKCFKPFDGWLNSTTPNSIIGEIPLKKVSFRRTMDNVGRIQGLVIESPEMSESFQFSVRNIRNSQKTEIIFWNGITTGTRRFPNVSQDCGSLL